MHFLSFSFYYLHPQGLTIKILVSPIPVGRARLWTRTLDTIPQYRVNRMSDSPPQHRTEHRALTPSPRIAIKIPDPTGNQTRAAGMDGRKGTLPTAPQ